MSRITLAFSCFFRLLFGLLLHPKAADYLPEGAKPRELPAGKDEPPKKDDTQAEAKPKPEAKKPESEAKPTPQKARPETRIADHRDGALAFLALLQRESRLVDFIREEIDDYADEDIGAAVRDIHRGCRKVLDDYFVLEAVMPGEEDDEVSIPKGFDPSEVRLIGEVSGEPPFQGVLRHHGWRTTKVTLPKLTEGVDREVLAPAEVELA